MAWVKTHRRVLPTLSASREYLVFIAPDTTDPEGVPEYLVTVPDLGVTTEGHDVEDAFYMGRDAGSMVLDMLEPWKRPRATTDVAVARAKLGEIWEGVFDPNTCKWESRMVAMEVPYKHWGDEHDEAGV